MLEDILKKEWEEVRESFPKLYDLNENSEGWQAEGQIEIIDTSGILWKTFSVRVQIPNIYPRIPPIIFETGGDLPIDPNCHINEDGSCCVGPNTRIFRKLNNNLTIKRWIDLIVIPYLSDQVYRLETGEYKGKEHAHGANGLINDYKEWWQLKTIDEVIYKLKLVTGETKLYRNTK